MSAARFIYIADVYCPWCYSFGPIMKRLSGEHPEFPVTAYGGNLMSEDTDLMRVAAQDPGLAQFWTEVEHTSGRSLAGALTALEEGRAVRIYSPGADMILQALKTLAPGHDLEQLLLLEDMFYARGADLFSLPALEQMAGHWNLDTNRLVKLINSTENQEATERAYEETRELMNGIDSYPTLLLARGNHIDAVSRGYVHYETVAQRLEDAMRDLGVETAHDEYCTSHGGCSFRHGTR